MRAWQPERLRYGDNRSLTQGKWTESKNDAKKKGQSGMTTVSTGDWSAKLRQ
jgi:hypothetical protein